MTAALYARVSTGEQNPDTQLTGMRRYCEVRTWTVGREFVDQVSGVVSDRPSLNELMAPGALRKFDVVLVWKLERIFRSVPHMLEALERFRTVGVDFVSVTECIDTTSPTGRPFVYTLLAAVAEFERDLIRERTRAGIARARTEGKRIGRPRAVFSAEEAQKLWNGGKGLSFRAIAAKMQSEGVKVSASKIFECLRNGVLKS